MKRANKIYFDCNLSMNFVHVDILKEKTIFKKIPAIFIETI